jgi:hypothetical protein
MIGSDSGFYSAFLDDVAARELWTDIDDVTAGWLFPGGQAVPVDGGFRVSGRWKFGSGCTHADVMVAGCIVMNDNGVPVFGPDGMPVVRTAVARADCFEVIDTWHTTGLAGSGSNDYACQGLFVPVEHTFSLAEPVKRDGPLHAIPGGFLANMQAVALGLARRAIADAQRQHRCAQAYASRSIDDAWTQLAFGAALSVDQRDSLDGCDDVTEPVHRINRSFSRFPHAALCPVRHDERMTIPDEARGVGAERAIQCS